MGAQVLAQLADAALAVPGDLGDLGETGQLGDVWLGVSSTPGPVFGDHVVPDHPHRLQRPVAEHGHLDEVDAARGVDGTVGAEGQPYGQDARAVVGGRIVVGELLLKGAEDRGRRLTAHLVLDTQDVSLGHSFLASVRRGGQGCRALPGIG